MKQRNLAFVYFIPLITFGIYTIVWWVKTKNEMVRLGASIPTAWLIIVPIAQLYWFYTYCQAAEQVTAGRIKGMAVFAGHLILSVLTAFLSNSAAGDSPAGNAAVILLMLLFQGLLVYLQANYNKVQTPVPGAASA